MPKTHALESAATEIDPFILKKCMKEMCQWANPLSSCLTKDVTVICLRLEHIENYITLHTHTHIYIPVKSTMADASNLYEGRACFEISPIRGLC
jgi:hypothetical protein